MTSLIKKKLKREKNHKNDKLSFVQLKTNFVFFEGLQNFLTIVLFWQVFFGVKEKLCNFKKEPCLDPNDKKLNKLNLKTLPIYCISAHLALGYTV